MISVIPNAVSGEFRCKRIEVEELTMCWKSTEDRNDSPRQSDFDYAAKLVFSNAIVDESTGEPMSWSRQHAVEQESVYFFSEKDGPSFVARCLEHICTWSFQDGAASSSASIDVIFTQSDLPRWKEIEDEVRILLAECRNNAEKYNLQ